MPKKEQKESCPGHSSIPRVAILGTGGTISGESQDPTLRGSYYTAGQRRIDELVSALPALQQIADVQTEQICNIPSHSIDMELWITLANRTNELLNEQNMDGVVIVHGTDSLEETAYFLNLTVKSSKPVILVGAMRPSNAVSSDGPLNLLNAVAVASSKESHGKGVLVVMDGKINGARDVSKCNTLSVETFNSHELGYFGYVIDNKPYFYKQSTKCHTVDTEFNTHDLQERKRVTILYGHAEQSPELVESAIRISDGIIQAGMGNGSMCPCIQTLLDHAVFQKNIPVVRTSRTGNGIITDKPVFKNSKFICGNNLSPQKARILLILSLSKTKNIEDIQRIFNCY